MVATARFALGVYHFALIDETVHLTLHIAIAGQ
jgi:hypothetical protein